MFTSLRGKIVVSSKSHDVHAEKIASLREQLAREKENLENMSQSQRCAQENLGVKSQAAATTELREKTARAMKNFLSTPWPLSTWKAMLPFYDAYRKEGGMESKVMIRTFQHHWQKRMEEIGQVLDFQITDVADR